MVPSRTAHAVLVVLVALAVALVLVVALPFATLLFVAAVLAGALAPLSARLSALLGGRRRLAALLVTLGVLLAIVGPLSAVGAALVPELVNGVAWVRGALQGQLLRRLAEHAPQVLQPALERAVAALPQSLDRLQGLVTAEGTRVATIFAGVLTATGTFLLQGVLMLVALYFLLVDGRGLVEWLNEAVPLKRGQVSELLREFRQVTVTVLVSTLATGGVQSVLALVGYLVAGVPNALFFGLVTFVLSLVPLLGATIVVLAVAVVMLATGHAGAGLLLAVWAVGVSLVDNVVKPLFIRGAIPIHGAVVFFALLGGIATFGPVGFLVGPLAVSFLVAVVRMYRLDYGQ